MRKESIKRFEDTIQVLPEMAAQEIMTFFEYSKFKYSKAPRRKKNFSFLWEGELSEFCNKNTSVELQHKANEWR